MNTSLLNDNNTLKKLSSASVKKTESSAAPLMVLMSLCRKSSPGSEQGLNSHFYPKQTEKPKKIEHLSSVFKSPIWTTDGSGSVIDPFYSHINSWSKPIILWYLTERVAKVSIQMMRKKHFWFWPVWRKLSDKTRKETRRIFAKLPYQSKSSDQTQNRSIWVKLWLESDYSINLGINQQLVFSLRWFCWTHRSETLFSGVSQRVLRSHWLTTSCRRYDCVRPRSSSRV